MYLAVADARVTGGVGSEHTAQGSDAHLILEGAVLGHGAVKVPLDLLCGQRAAPHCLLHQLSIVTRVGGHFVLGTWRGGASGVVEGHRDGGKDWVWGGGEWMC